MAEIGRVDTCLEVITISSCLVLPIEDHLNQLYRVLACLKKLHSTDFAFDPSDPVVDASKVDQRDWTPSDFGNSAELLARILQHRVINFVVRAKVDVDHDPGTVTKLTLSSVEIACKSTDI